MLPLGALIVGFFAVAVPAILLMSIWAGVTAWRLLFPDEPSPAERAHHRRTAQHGDFVPVRLRDIVEDQRARQSVPSDGSVPEWHPLEGDLWLRRN